MNKFKVGDIVVCINSAYNRLTIGKNYIILPERLTDRSDVIRIVNDLGHESHYSPELFISLIEKRSNIIDWILE